MRRQEGVHMSPLRASNYCPLFSSPFVSQIFPSLSYVSKFCNLFLICNNIEFCILENSRNVASLCVAGEYSL